MKATDIFNVGNFNSTDHRVETIDSVRSQLANAAIISSLISAFFIVSASLSRALVIGWQNVMTYHVIILLAAFSLAIFYNRLSYNIRALIVPCSFFVLGTAGLFRLGLIGMGIPTLIAVSILVTIFFGIRYGLLALAANLGVIAMVAIGVNLGHISFTFNIEKYSVSLFSWLLAAIGSAYFMCLIVATLGRMHRSLVDSIGSLNKRTWELQQTNEQLNMEIVERKRADEALRNSEEKYRQLSDLLPQVVFETDSEGKLTFANRIAFDLFGYRKDELKAGLSAFEMLVPEERDKALEKMHKILKGEKTLGSEFTALRKDRSTFPVLLYANRIMNNGTPVGLRGIMADLSEVKRAHEALRESEEKLTRSKKMESLGLLASGVAHDLNNVLSGIVSYPELILMGLPEGSNLKKPIETIRESGQRAADIVEDLLTVARGVATIKEPLNLNDLINDYLNSPEFIKLERFHPMITIKTKLDADLFNIGGSNVHIRKVIMNLVSNASEAIEGRGHVTISTINRYVDRPLKGYDQVNIGEYVVLSVSDDGSGISTGDLKRIFEPFYTKKVMGRSGTGLGLAVVWNTVQDHEGYIDVKSDGNGTTFELYFPITRGELLDKDLAVSIEDLKGKGETILVVDDVENQRDISCKMMETLGYSARSVSSGEEAVEYLRENTVDLLLLDMIMDPGINGRETYEKVIKIHPKQKAIIVSGFAETDEVVEAQKLGTGKYIKKPLSLEKIGIAVKEELQK